MIIKNYGSPAKIKPVLTRVTEADIINGTCAIPDDVTEICRFAFDCCNNLKSIDIPNSVTEIGNYAFISCKNLESINIPDSVAKIGIHTFYDCENLTHVQWGDTVYNVKCVDRRCMNVIQEKRHGGCTIYKCQHFPRLEEIIWIAEKDGITACRTSPKSAIRAVRLELLHNRDISEHVARIKSQGYVTPMDYCLITGACKAGTDKFLRKNNLSWNDTRTIQETIELTEGEYGHETFIKAIKKYGGMP